MSLPIFKSEDKELMLLQTKWSSELNPIIRDPENQGHILQDVVLQSGLNIINHKLGRKLLGWQTTRVRASATIYDTQDSNPNPESTLYLNASANVTINLKVF